jgi:hydroxymethylbilane synthase
MKRTHICGTRGSKLSIAQTKGLIQSVRSFHPEAAFEIRLIKTVGDRDRKTPISNVEGTDFFTKEIEAALLAGAIDCAVHSAKDLPDVLPHGLILAAVTEPIDPCDVLVSKENYTLETLPEGARVGTSSTRRKEFLEKYRPDVQILDLRGNVDERVKMVDEGKYDAILLAAAGLIRLGLEDRIGYRIPLELLEPTPGQGSLAVEVRSDDAEIRALFKELDAHSAEWNRKLGVRT